MNYNIKLSYVVSITESVDANDEGEALSKARELAEDADLNQFEFEREIESVLSQQ